jgi:ATP synthase protein I
VTALAERRARDDPGSRQGFATTVGRKAERKRKAQRERRRSLLFGLGMFGLVGWSVAVPTVLGTLLGLWLDGQFPGPPSWTLTCLFAGVVIGCLNAWYWVRRESRND